tara:strand:+ start:358 stop:750 length:393 start_codon:yes stop_codon:yes gene_type:complete
MPYNRKSPLPMMVAGKQKLEKDNPPPEMVSLVRRDASGNVIPEVRGGAGFLGFLGGNALSGGKMLFEGAGRLFRLFTNAPKQYMKGAGRNVPVVGKPGKTVKVKDPDTKMVSYANPKISMTAAERRAAGY